MDKKVYEAKKLIEWEQIAAKQIKNTFSDVKTIKFKEETVKFNCGTGYTDVNVIIVTKYQRGEITISLPTNKECRTLPSYTGIHPREGTTQEIVKVIYTNKKEKKFE